MEVTLDTLRGLVRMVSDPSGTGPHAWDLTPLLGDDRAFRAAVERMAAAVAGEGFHVIASPGAFGASLGSAVAAHLGRRFVQIPAALPRTPPGDTSSANPEIGRDTAPGPLAAIGPGDRVLFLDAVLATGATTAACARRLQRRGANVVGCLYLIEIPALEGRSLLKDYRVVSVLEEAP
ncbi:MAG: adenine phosphoribosyltransferase [Planctomycetota bacterium]